jgi:hypothetical protein
MTTLQPESPEIAIRRRKLREWIEKKFNKSQVQFIDDCAKRGHLINQGELSGLLKSKSFGEKKARKLETMAQMPVNYLNQVLPQHLADQHQARDNNMADSYLWPFKDITPWDYNNTLTVGDREAVEATAQALFKARSSPIKQVQPATNNASGSAA